MSDVWTSWHPQVGDRVRVRLSKECALHWDQHPHDILQAIDGRTGYVIKTDDPREPSHPIAIIFDDPPIIGGQACMAHLAVAELDPLPAIEESVP